MFITRHLFQTVSSFLTFTFHRVEQLLIRVEQLLNTLCTGCVLSAFIKRILYCIVTVMPLRCTGIFSNYFITHLLPSPTVKSFENWQWRRQKIILGWA